MEQDYLDIEREHRRQIVFGALVAIVILGSIIYYFWGNLINRGTLLIYGELPFTAEFYETKESYNCDVSPCKIVKSMGSKMFLVKKDGYETLFTSADIKLWRTVEVKLDMAIIPHFEKVETIPQEEKFQYSLVIDAGNQMQKLVKTDDVAQKAIVYFPKHLKNPEAFGSGKMVLVVDKGGEASYKINVVKKTKEQVTDATQLKNIISGKWSNDGNFFVGSMLRQKNLWMMYESNKIEQINTSANVDTVTWIKDHELIIVTENGVETYDPASKTGSAIDLTENLPEAPSIVISTSNGDIYVKTEKSSYKLILEKF
ncbi:MAG: hypothetical protein WC285_01935 [Candidatus Gracilibacteria bacterium]|jgi:hypothetical protein